jgi:hypothetical protein
MKKSNLTVLFCYFVAALNGQTYWTTVPAALPTAESAKLGTNNGKCLQLVTNDSTRMEISGLGDIKVLKFATSSITNDRPVVVTPSGTFKAINIGGSSNFDTYCGVGPMPWYEGGNYVYSSSSSGNVIGTCNDVPFILKSYNTPLVYLATDGNVGIGSGNNAPSAALDILESGEHMKIWGGGMSSTTDFVLQTGSTDNFFVTRGISSTNLSIVNDKVGIGTTAATTKLHVEAGSSDGILNKTNSGSTKAICVNNTSINRDMFYVLGSGKTVVGNEANSSNAAHLNINVAGSSTPINALDIYDSYTNKVNFRVKSDGTVFCRELRVLVTTSTFPDFVFESNYELMSLHAREEFVKRYKHLPHVKSGRQIESEGLSLHDLTSVLRNVEELTLYTIQLNRRVEQLESENKLLRDNIRALTELVKK